jgi:hypothetical protein
MDATVYERYCHDGSQISTSIVRFSDPGMTAANSNCLTIKNATKSQITERAVAFRFSTIVPSTDLPDG